MSQEVYEKIVPGKIAVKYLGEEILRGIEKPVKVFKGELETEV